MPLLGFLNPLDNVHKFDPDRDIPDLAGKVIIVTGGNSGCGKETVLQLAKHNPGCIYLAARSKAKFDDAMKDVSAAAPDANVRFLEMDLSSLASVKRAADQVVADNDRVDILVNNAGIMAHPHGVSEDGYEIQFATNHMGHALLTRLLLPLMQRTASQPSSDVRIVNVSSAGHMMVTGPGIHFEKLKTSIDSFNPMMLYGQTKLANILHARELARRYPDILSTSIHPGRVETNLTNVMFDVNGFFGRFQRVFDSLAGQLTVQQGTLTQLWAATWKRDEVKNGAYYVPVGKEAGSKKSQDPELAKKLWEWTESELAAKGY
jgi:NAD(P)-dependent dehydrogenase (short-subunit alcohol dehydrogenase family)